MGRRPRSSDILSYDTLYDLYIVQGLTTYDIGERYHFHPATIQSLLRKYSIKKDRDTLYTERTNKTQASYFKKYGVYNNSQLPDWKEKVQSTCQERYGVDNVSQLSSVKKKVQSTCQERYGVDNVSQIEDNKISTKNSIKFTNLEKYGVPFACLLPQCSTKNNKTISASNLWWKEHIEAPVELEYTLEDRAYDIHLIDTPVLLEINPSLTHNSNFSVYTRSMEGAKPTDYHLKKSKLASKNGYHCIHVWDWDDKYKILNLFKEKDKLFARKLRIAQASRKEAHDFNNTYHLQGSCRGQDYCLGLYQGRELVSLMTFGKPRYNRHYQWELLRYTTHCQYMVIGGAERLFKHFVQVQEPDSIVSYCDYSKFTGKVYEKLGFMKIRLNRPSCHWVKGKQHITQAQLSKYGFDRLLGKVYGTFGKGTDNESLMLQHGFVQVYDCGQFMYGWKGGDSMK